MGNCLTCFKEPPSTALESNNATHCLKEEMPEAPSSHHHHLLQQSPVVETSLLSLSNGNHINSAPFYSNSLNLRTLVKSAPPVSSSVVVAAMGAIESKSSHLTTTEAKLNNLFDVYKDCEEEDSILAEGIEQLCIDLQVSPEEFKVLVLAWKLNAEQMCKFTRNEFVTGLKSMNCESIKQIQQKLPEIINEIKINNELFKDLYKFTFKFGLDSPSRSLSTDMAISLWRLVFNVNEPPILNRWLEFLESHRNSIKGIPRDTWYMFLNFSESVGDDLSSYDDNEAWPCLFDDFVEYERDQMNQNVTKESKERQGIFI